MSIISFSYIFLIENDVYPKHVLVEIHILEQSIVLSV